MTPEREDEVITSILGEDDDCAHNFAPLFLLIDKWLAEERAEVCARVEAALSTARAVEMSGGYIDVFVPADNIRDALRGEGHE